MARPIHVAIGSTMSKPGNVAGNLQQIAEFAKRAAADGVDLLLTPELSACGYGPYPEVLATAEAAGKGPVYAGLAAMAAKAKTVICAGFAEAAAGKTYLAHYGVWPDGRFIVQRKHRVMLTEQPFDAAAELVPPDREQSPPDDPADPGQPRGIDFTVFDVKGVRCALVICADWHIHGLLEHLAAKKVDLLLRPAGAGGRREDRVTTDELATDEGRAKYMKILQGAFFPGPLVADCMKYRMAAASVDQCGFDGFSRCHLGHGTIVNAMGEVPALIHGLPNLDRQRPQYTHAWLDADDRLPER
jgi:predicted amidohydrolase